MEIAVNDTGSAATVVLTGRLDISGAEAVALPLATLSGGKTSLKIDMTGVTFVASIGLRHLVMAAKALRRRGGTLVLVNPTTAVAEVITISGLGELLPVERAG
jgi:anti-sigma B factor antagonist